MLRPLLEYDTGDHGKADLYIENARPGGQKILLELKYLSKNKASESAVAAKLSEALAQLRRYSAGPRLRGVRPLKCWAVVFAGGKAVRVQQAEPEVAQ